MDIIILLLLTAIIIPAIYAAVVGAPTLPSVGPNIEEALRKAGVGPGVRFYELGTGTGRISRKALRMGAMVTGYELSPIAYIWSFVSLSLTGRRFRLVMSDFFRGDISGAEVIYTFLTPKTMEAFTKKISKEAKLGTRIISYAFPMDGILPIATIKDGRTAPIYIYKM